MLFELYYLGRLELLNVCSWRMDCSWDVFDCSFGLFACLLDILALFLVCEQT